MICRFCGARNYSHKRGCPSLVEDVNSYTLWHKGYQDAQEKNLETSEDPSYLLGYTAGETALKEEEAERIKHS